ncbi:hypothetical protein [Paractinoplanes rishiriensis]|uniref:Uncharacterized protein n=1 Tax=Paractinoplanes rishiriensis TaxID=1050105 RepID=A0A919K159_9ACTN|nr:hypothetical protein [Actinoplanes rishiriensis]GIE94721.1 hypothetical protein Ari01nite_21860 [Actinoplanes rishiriensis]
MTEHADQLREAFETQENQTPDPVAVFARVQELSRKYQRRRRTVAVAGSAFLGVGLIAGATQLPNILAGNAPADSTIYAGAPAVAPSSVAPSVSSAEADLERYWAAYFGAGYDWDDAQRLAVLWQMKDEETGRVKAEAGRRLLAGETLPFPATPDAPEPTDQGSPITEEQYAWARIFFEAGYTYEDAVRLAELWKLDEPYDAKVAAGRKLDAGETLPIKPKPENVESAKDERAVGKFFDEGYDYDDAVELATLWKLKTPYDAKIAGGKKLLAGETLPIKP